VTFGISNLPTGYVGEALPGRILLSTNAAGQAWFIDTTPFDNSEFTGTGTRLIAVSGGPAVGRVDALTVILHELDHELGAEDTYMISDRSNLMYGYLSLGERRLPAVNQALGLTAPTGNFADALHLAPPAASQMPAPAFSTLPPAVIIHQPVMPSVLVPREIQSIELPVQPTNTGRLWINPASIVPGTIYVTPELPSESPTTLEIEPGNQEPNVEPKTTIQNPATSRSRTPLSFIELEAGKIWEPSPRKNLRENFRTKFTTGSLDIGQYLPPTPNP
jgi:hypothetical protein